MDMTKPANVLARLDETAKTLRIAGVSAQENGQVRWAENVKICQSDVQAARSKIEDALKELCGIAHQLEGGETVIIEPESVKASRVVEAVAACGLLGE